MKKKSSKRELSASELVTRAREFEKRPPYYLRLAKNLYQQSSVSFCGLFAIWKKRKLGLATLSTYLNSIGLYEKWLVELIHRYEIMNPRDQSETPIITNERPLSSRTLALMVTSAVAMPSIILVLIWSLPIQPNSYVPLFIMGLLNGRLGLVIYERTILHKKAIRILRTRAPWLFASTNSDKK